MEHGLKREELVSAIIVDIEEARCDLAAIFRWSAREGLHEGIANHFSYAVSDDGQMFLMNPYGRHFSKMKASDMLLVDAQELSAENAERIDPQPGLSMGRCIAIIRRHGVSCICIRITQQR